MLETQNQKVCVPSKLKRNIRQAVDKNLNGELAELTKAIGHPVRIQILRMLLDRNACVCGEIVDELPFAQSTISQHLKVLKKAGLIQGEVDGPRICYCVDGKTLKRLKSLITAL